MKIIYASTKTESQCTDLKAATKLFGGDKNKAVKLMSRIYAIENAVVIKDIIMMREFNFHKLSNKNGKNLEGYFAIDVKSRKDPWRIILEPLDDEEKPFIPCNIDEISTKVRIVCITEVSNHYE